MEIKKLEKSQIEITSSIPTEYFESFRKKALDNINSSIAVDGFRKGKIPENILVSKVGEMSILEEMAELAISEAYPKILIENKIDAIGKPEIHIMKIAKGNPLEFRVITAVIPEIKLADYKSISKEEKERKLDKKEINDKEIDEAINRIRRSRVDHSSHNHEKMNHEEHEKAIESSLPEFNDEFVKSLGDFKDIPDFKNKLKIMLEEDEENKIKEKKRIAIADKLIDSSMIDLPEILIKSEAERIENQFSMDIERMGIKLEDYLKHAKKTIEDLRKEWRPQAERKAKLQLILNKISEKENIKPNEKELETEINHILEHYKDADKERVRVYADTVLTNEKVFQFLED